MALSCLYEHVAVAAYDVDARAVGVKCLGCPAGY